MVVEDELKGLPGKKWYKAGFGVKWRAILRRITYAKSVKPVFGEFKGEGIS